MFNKSNKFKYQSSNPFVSLVNDSIMFFSKLTFTTA